jgi:AAA+ ATPase superfamily predicted ATPase
LTRFLARDDDGPRLGVVSGRRRMGKTYLLQAVAEQAGGLYFGATEATETESLGLFAAALGRHLEAAVPPRFADWDEAIRYLFSVGERIGPAVIDEFPYLTSAAPAMPSILQREIDRATSAAQPTTVLLCGSALSVMGRLLAGNAPLRGRAGLELGVRPFAYGVAAEYWEVADDPRLAVMLHAIVGGTPAYRRFVSGDRPDGVADFDDWVRRAVLDPGSPLFREARHLLDEDLDVRDSAMYHSVLSAIAQGNSTRGGVANYVGRKAADIGHHLNVLEDSALVRREPDLFRSGRSTYRIAEPLVVFYQVVMRPLWGQLESGLADRVWPSGRTRFSAQVLGPHFEQLCREYELTAGADRYAELPADVGAGVVFDSSKRRPIEVDVVVLAAAEPGRPRKVLSLGEAKWGDVMGGRDLDRLRRARDLLTERGYDTADTVLTCYSGAGFAEDLEGSGVRTVGLADLYRQ